MKTGLGALLHPREVTEFLKIYKNNEPFFVQNSGQFLTSLTSLPFLTSLDDLLNSWPSTIQAHLPDLRDEESSIDVNNKDAKKLFNNGMGLLFNEVQTISPILTQWLQEISHSLGLSSMSFGRCLIYATPDGKGTAPHFDQNINFVLQIHGTKKWRMAPNKSVINPLTRSTMGANPDPELMSYIDSPLPKSMPVDSLTFDLKPGSLLFVPRGWWHSTEAQGDALALNFTFTAPTWIDLFTAAMRSRLALSAEWRETALVGHEDKFDFLLSALSAELPHWRASDILEATESEEEKL